MLVPAKGVVSVPGKTMDRQDILRAREKVPDLDTVWEHKIMRLEMDREKVWNDLRRRPRLGSDEETMEQQTEGAYQKIHRLDRSIAFLDRALLHLSDLEHDTHYADRLPLRP